MDRQRRFRCCSLYFTFHCYVAGLAYHLLGNFLPGYTYILIISCTIVIRNIRCGRKYRDLTYLCCKFHRIHSGNRCHIHITSDRDHCLCHLAACQIDTVDRYHTVICKLAFIHLIPSYICRYQFAFRCTCIDKRRKCRNYACLCCNVNRVNLLNRHTVNLKTIDTGSCCWQYHVQAQLCRCDRIKFDGIITIPLVALAIWCLDIDILPVAFRIFILHCNRSWNSGSAVIIIPVNISFIDCYRLLPGICYPVCTSRSAGTSPVAPAFAGSYIGASRFKFCIIDSINGLPACYIICRRRCSRSHIIISGCHLFQFDRQICWSRQFSVICSKSYNISACHRSCQRCLKLCTISKENSCTFRLLNSFPLISQCSVIWDTVINTFCNKSGLEISFFLTVYGNLYNRSSILDHITFSAFVVCLNLSYRRIMTRLIGKCNTEFIGLYCCKFDIIIVCLRH